MEIYSPLFQTFMALAGQCGKPVNYRTLAKELSIAPPAAKLRVQRLACMDLIFLVPALQNEAKTKRVKGDAVYLKHLDAQMHRFPELKENLKNPSAWAGSSSRSGAHTVSRARPSSSIPVVSST